MCVCVSMGMHMNEFVGYENKLKNGDTFCVCVKDFKMFVM